MSDLVIYVAIISAISLVLLIVKLILQSRQNNNRGDDVDRPQLNVPRRRNVGDEGIPRGGAAVRNMRARQRRLQRPQQNEDNVDDSEGDDDAPMGAGDREERLARVGREIPLPDGPIGAKKLRKLEMKAERKATREREEEEREERKKREEKREEERKKIEDKQKKEEQEKLDEERKFAEEKAKREAEEYAALKAAFTIEEEGFDESAVDEDVQEDLLQKFINYIQNKKVVMIEEVAAEFHLKAVDVIDRIQTLQTEGRLTGVMDDRGKFIFITRAELEAVAKFIKQRGRVSIVDLVECSNKLIDLSGVNS